jgi:hypothetical protein
MCARALASWYCAAKLSTVSVRLRSHTVTQKTLTHTSYTQNTGKYMSRNDGVSTLALQHSISSNQPRKKNIFTTAMKAWQKCPVAGPTTGCRPKQAACIEEKQRVRQPSVSKTKQKRTNIHMQRHTSIYVGIYDCMRSESESELGHQLSGILRKANKQTCMLVCLCICMCVRSESESASHSSPPQLIGVRVITEYARTRLCMLTLFR